MKGVFKLELKTERLKQSLNIIYELVDGRAQKRSYFEMCHNIVKPVLIEVTIYSVCHDKAEGRAGFSASS